MIDEHDAMAESTDAISAFYQEMNDDIGAKTVYGCEITDDDKAMTDDDNAMTDDDNAMTDDIKAMTDDIKAMTDDNKAMTADRKNE